MKKTILKQIVSDPPPSEITITTKLLVDEFIYVANKSGIVNGFGTPDAISVGEDLMSFAGEIEDMRQEGGIGNVTQFQLDGIPQPEAALLLKKELEGNDWNFADAMRMISSLVSSGYFDRRDNLVSIFLKETPGHRSINRKIIRFKLEVERNLHGNLYLDVIMHIISPYNLNADFKEDVCDDGRNCVYILRN
jgi:hypothetical protein